MARLHLEGSAAVFDFDGTVIDSFMHRGAIHKKISSFLLDHMGERNNEDNLKKMVDIVTRINIEMHQDKLYDRNLWWARVVGRYGGKDLKLSEPAITEATVLYWDLIKRNSKVYPGVTRMLNTLKSDSVRLGLISDTDGLKGMKMERIESSGLAKLFDVILVAGEDTPQVKPDPGAFVLMLNKLGVNSRNCVSVGDNPATDVDGALRAGMKVIIIKNNLAAQTSTSQRYYLVDRRNLTGFIVETLQQAEAPKQI